MQTGRLADSGRLLAVGSVGFCMSKVLSAALSDADVSLSADACDVPAAAILDDGSQDADALLASLALQLQQAGRQVRGLVMTYPDGRQTCAGAMVLVDVLTRDSYLVSQALGSGSNACRADVQGFARASQVLRDALVAAPDLVISNRFAGLEAEGGGFAAELLQLMAQGVPVLTAVAPRYVPAWTRFTGGAPVLPATDGALQAWLNQALAQPLPIQLALALGKNSCSPSIL